MKEIINIIDNLDNETLEDKEQIKRALKCTTYTLLDNNKEEIISRKKAIEILGAETFVSGLERSAFHCTSVRDNNGRAVFFDSSKLVKE